MTTKADWEFRAEHLEDMAAVLLRKAEEMKAEAGRFRGLAEQAQKNRGRDVSDDIVKRLRDHVNNRGGPSIQNGAWEMMLEAATEIAKLRRSVLLAEAGSCAQDDCPYPDCLVDGECPSQPSLAQ